MLSGRRVKEQLAHVVKEQKRKTEQKKELDKTKEFEQKRRKADHLSKERRDVKEGVHLEC